MLSYPALVAKLLGLDTAMIECLVKRKDIRASLAIGLLVANIQ